MLTITFTGVSDLGAQDSSVGCAVRAQARLTLKVMVVVRPVPYTVADRFGSHQTKPSYHHPPSPQPQARSSDRRLGAEQGEVQLATRQRALVAAGRDSADHVDEMPADAGLPGERTAVCENDLLQPPR